MSLKGKLMNCQNLNDVVCMDTTSNETQNHLLTSERIQKNLLHRQVPQMKRMNLHLHIQYAHTHVLLIRTVSAHALVLCVASVQRRYSA